VRPCSNTPQYEERKAMFKYLLAEAPDLTIVKNAEGDSAIAIACKNDLLDCVVHLLRNTGIQMSKKYIDPVLKNNITLDIWLNLIKFTLLKINTKCKSFKHVSSNILETIFDRKFWPVFKKDIVFLFEGTINALMQNKQIKSDEELLTVHSIKFEPLCYDAVSFAFKTFIMGNEYEVDDETEFLAGMLMDYTNRSKDPSLNHYVSPLTILMCKEVTESSMNIFNEMIQRGVNVESQTLQVKEIECQGLIDDEELLYNDQERARYYNDIKNKLKLPDALLVAFLTKKHEYVETLLSYWWAPPIALLFFNPNLCIEDFNFWFPKLIKYGGIIHGRLFQQLVHRILTLEMAGDEEWNQLYLQYLTQWNQISSKYKTDLFK
jgi:hypothetical protein